MGPHIYGGGWRGISRDIFHTLFILGATSPPSVIVLLSNISILWSCTKWIAAGRGREWGSARDEVPREMGACFWLLAWLQLHALTSVAELHPQMAAKSLVTKPRALECHGPPRLNRIEPESQRKCIFKPYNIVLYQTANTEICRNYLC